jgi:hypothetical protein
MEKALKLYCVKFCFGDVDGQTSVWASSEEEANHLVKENLCACFPLLGNFKVIEVTDSP